MDEATGRTEAGLLPHYTAAGSEARWKPVFDEIRARLRRRGLEDRLFLGMSTDMQPSRDQVTFFQFEMAAEAERRAP